MKKSLLLISAITMGLSSYAQYEGFENWTNSSLQSLNDYDNPVEDRGIEGGLAIFQSPDFVSGSASVRLETVLSPMFGDTIFGYFVSGDPEPPIQPGQPSGFNGVDSIIGYYKYDIMVGDSCLFIANTTMLGISTGGGTFHITGQQLTWKRFAFPILSLSSDSLVLAVATGDPLNGFNGIPGTWIQYDDIRVKKGAQTLSVANGDFENWTIIPWDEPNGWETPNTGAIGEPLMPVVKTTDKNSGTFALELNTILNSHGDTTVGIATNGNFSSTGAHGGTPYTANPSGLEFYYKNTFAGIDTAFVSITFKNGGALIGQYGGQLTPAASYTLFTQILSLPMNPDSVLITAFSGSNPGSQLYLDDIDFLFTVGISENLSVEKIVSYPNPATDKLRIKFNILKNNDVSIRLVDALGKELITSSLGRLSVGTYRESFNTSNFSTGIYFIEFTLGNEKITERFMVK